MNDDQDETPPEENGAPDDLEAILAGLGEDPSPPHPDVETALPAPSLPEGQTALAGGERRFAELSAVVDELTKAVDWTVEQLSEHPAGGPWFWEALDAASAKDLWKEVGEFVLWLNSRILGHISAGDVQPLPGCWFRHPDVVEQLTALMVAHKAAYHPLNKKASFELVNFFDRALWPTMRAVKNNGTLSGCMGGSHREKSVEPYSHDAAFNSFTALDTTVSREGGNDR